MRRLQPSFALALCLALLSAQALTAQKYTVTDLGTLGGVQSVGIDISQSGDVTGSSGLTCQGCWKREREGRKGPGDRLFTYPSMFGVGLWASPCFPVQQWHYERSRTDHRIWHSQRSDSRILVDPNLLSEQTTQHGQ
jgi:hypothetical protein